MSYTCLILPYAVEDADRKKPFTHDMEVAAILCLAEAERKKPGILDISPERISFISKLHYPLWAVPWENECFIVDGLGFFSHTIVHMKPPDVKLFTEDIKRSTAVRKLYRSALERHAQTFKDFIGTAQIPIEAVISDKELLSTIFEYLKQSFTSKRNAAGLIGLAPPKLNEKAALEAARKVIDHWGQIQSEIKGLQYAIGVLNEETDFHEHKILREIEQVRGMYEKEILRVKPLIGKRVERLIRERDAKIKKATKATEREVIAALKERDKQERKLRRLERSKREFERKRDARKRRGDRPGESYWNSEVKRCKIKMSEIEERIQALSHRIERARKQNEAAIKKLKKDYQAMIDRERRRIEDLEASRDYEIAMKRKEIKELRSEASSIINLVEQLIEQKRLHASQLKEVTIPWRSEGVTLICVPFYLVQYETEAKSRSRLYAPVIATGYEGIIKKIQKAIWSFSLEYRIKLLLRPRSRALKRMFTSVLAKKTREDKALKEILHRLGCSNNLLTIPNFREVLARGMEELKVEGWVSSEEKDAILYTYAPP
jgi:hypothetical protein